MPLGTFEPLHEVEYHGWWVEWEDGGVGIKVKRVLAQAAWCLPLFPVKLLLLSGFSLPLSVHLQFSNLIKMLLR